MNSDNKEEVEWWRCTEDDNPFELSEASRRKVEGYLYTTQVRPKVLKKKGIIRVKKKR
jgi:hypothetical protein